MMQKIRPRSTNALDAHARRMPALHQIVLCGITVWAIGCSDGVGSDRFPPPDAGMDGVDVSEMPDEAPCPSERFEHGICAPEAPSPPAFVDWTCPENWRSTPALTDEDGAPMSVEGVESFDMCVPPEPPTDCTAGFMPLLGSAECVRQGLACPEGALWHDEATIRTRAGAPEGRIHYVDAGADIGGEGTREAPYGAILEALFYADPGDVIALGVGDHVEQVSLLDNEGLALVGACSEATRIVAPSPEPLSPTIALEGGRDIRFSDLSITGHRIGMEVLDLAGTLTLEAITIEDVTGGGITVEISPDLHLIAEDLYMHRVLEDEEDFVAGAFIVDDIGVLTLRRASFVDVEGGGLVSNDEGLEATVEDLLVIGPSGGEAGSYHSPGLCVFFGGRIELRRALFDKTTFAAVELVDPDAVLDAEDVIIRHTRPWDGLGGWGMDLSLGSQAIMRRTAVISNLDVGVYISDPGTKASLEDFVIIDTHPQPMEDDSGRGLQINFGAAARLTRALLLRNHDLAIFAEDQDTRLVLEDTAIIDTRAEASEGRGGRGLNIQTDAHVTARRLVLVGNRDLSAFVEAAQLELEDTLIDNTQPQDLSQSSGLALKVQGGGRVTLLRGQVRTSHEVGVLVLDPGSRAALTDLLVSNTLRAACAPDCPDHGSGVVVKQGASLTLDRFIIHGSALAGLQILDPNTFRASRGLIHTNTIGVNVQTEALSLSQAFVDVLAFDNARDFDAQDLAVPDASEAFEAIKSIQD